MIQAEQPFLLADGVWVEVRDGHLTAMSCGVTKTRRLLVLEAAP